MKEYKVFDVQDVDIDLKNIVMDYFGECHNQSYHFWQVAKVKNLNGMMKR